MTRKAIPKRAAHRRPVAMTPLHRVHADLVGPLRVQSAQNKYFLLLTDEFSAYRWVIQSKTKTEASQKLLDLLKNWRNINKAASNSSMQIMKRNL